MVPTRVVGDERRLPNWITSFIGLTSNLNTPVLFRKWAAISIIASALERKVWCRTGTADLYSNLYVILVGPPGVGKSVIVSFAERLLRQLEEIHVAPSSVTSASLVDTMAISQRKIVWPEYLQFHSTQVISSELQNFLPAYDPAFMGVLTKMYDCELYEERRRTGKVNHIKLERTQLSMLAGTTPSYLNSLLPEGAWDQGFTSRTIFVFSKEGAQVDIFGESNIDDEQFRRIASEDLLIDLRSIFKHQGQSVWTAEARKEIQDWVNAGLPPAPEHARLTHYKSRRMVHALKLGTVASIARGGKLEVLPEDFHTALAWLLEVEDLMPDIFSSMSMTAEARIMEDARYHIKKIYEKSKRPVPEYHLMNYLKDRIPSQNLAKVIEVMVKSRMLKVEYVSGLAHYTP